MNKIINGKRYDTEKAQELVDRIAAEHGTVDILVNNAGNHCKKYIWDMSVEEYKSVLDVHLTGAFALTKAVVPYMKEKRHGRIIFQASMTSYIGQPMVAGYASAKAGYLGLIHTLTAELAEYGITANAIAPGWIDTPMFHKATDGDPQRLGKILGRIPAKMVGDCGSNILIKVPYNFPFLSSFSAELSYAAGRLWIPTLPIYY
jgi:gluconate 5-dehydrogenase